MKRMLLLFVLAGSVLAVLPATADAKGPCRNKIFSDWYHDGQIASTYPLGCYRDALAHVRDGDAIYTSLEEDIRSALQAAIQRRDGKKVADQIGHRFTPNDSQPILVDQHRPAKQTKTTSSPGGESHEAAPPMVASDASSNGVPLPLLLLGGLALALIAAGALGLVVRRRRGPVS